MPKFTLRDFLVESNYIEGIHRSEDILDDEETVAMAFLGRETLSVIDFEIIVDTFAGPEAKLRDTWGMDVQIGSFFPQKGGPEIRQRLKDLIALGSVSHYHPNSKVVRQAHTLHLQYEHLHPFMDGNGRSGRLFWLKCMGGIENVPLGFLHTFYYQTLEATQNGG